MTWGEFEGEHAIRSLCFHTNLTEYGPYGLKDQGTSVTIPMEGGVVVGFHGRAGRLLNAIGVYVAPKNRSFCPIQDPENLSTHIEVSFYLFYLFFLLLWCPASLCAPELIPICKG